jgi:outer membrane protein OmpA-like peptidoglycan-associated protein
MGLVNYAIMKDNTKKELVTIEDAQSWIKEYDNSRKVVEFSKGKFLTSIPYDADARFVMKNIQDARIFAEHFSGSQYADAVVTQSLVHIPESNLPELVSIFPNLDISAKLKMQIILNSKNIDEWIRYTAEYPDIIIKADQVVIQKKIRELCTNLDFLSRLVNMNPGYVSISVLEVMGLEFVKTREDIVAYRKIFPKSAQERALEGIAMKTVIDFDSGIKVKEMFSITTTHPILDSLLLRYISNMNHVKIFKKECSYSAFTHLLPEKAIQFVGSFSDLSDFIALFPNNELIDKYIESKEILLTREEIIYIIEKVTYSKRLSLLKKRLVDISITFDECIEATKYCSECLEQLAGKCIGFLVKSQDYRRFLRYFMNTEYGKDIQFKYYEMISIEPENLGENINTEYGDYAPKISPDGETLYFVRKDHLDGYGGEDIYVSNTDEYGDWGLAQNIETPLNNSGHNFIYSISQDGQELFLHNQYETPGSNPSITRLEDQAWSDPKTQFIPKMNSLGDYHNGSVTVDGKYLLMSIKRYDSYGGNDIYIIHKDEYGNWQEPINLGPTINTYAEEGSVFIAADGETMYFSSAGHGGYGNQDMFLSRRLDNTWTNWSTPTNLGGRINSDSKDNFYVIPAKGDFIYFSSEREGSFGKEDIYRIGLPLEMRPKPVTLITGRVVNQKNMQTVSATVYYYDLETGEKLGSVSTNPKTGEFKFILVRGKRVIYYAVADKFLSQSEYADLKNLETYILELKDIALIPIESGQSITMTNLFFDSKQWTLKPESYLELNRIVVFLQQNPTVKIEIGGHTDDVGSDENNLNLSEKRAFEVYMYFISKNISKERLTYVGYGETKLKVPNTNDQNRAMNRRVELMIK